MLLNALFESFSISLILPLTQDIILGKPQGLFGELLIPLQKQLGIELFLPFISLIILAAIIVKSLTAFLNNIYSKKFSLELRNRWMDEIFYKYMHSDLSYMQKVKHGELIHNLLTETRRTSICTLLIARFFSKIMVMLALITILFLTAPFITGIISFLAIVTLSSIFIIQKMAKRTGKELQKHLKSVSEEASESITGIRQIKIMGIEDVRLSNFKAYNRQLLNTELKLEFSTSLPARIIEILMGTITVVALLLFFFVKGTELTSVLPIIALLSFAGMKILNNAAAALTLYWQIASFFPALESVFKILHNHQITEDKEKGQSIKSLNNDIVIKNLTFSYNPQDDPVINNLNATIPMRGITQFKGDSGSGKSTFADLIMGFNTPTSGSIMINNTHLQELNIREWRNKISYIPQNIFIFHATVYENIAAGNRDASEQDVIKAANDACAHEFIQNLPDSYQTMLSDHGTNLSGGERQRIAIARALLRNPDLIIFDEATNALDRVVEDKIFLLIKDIAKTKAVIVMTHSTAFANFAEQTYLLK